MGLIEIIQTTLAIGTLIGSFLNARKMRSCFVVWLICNIGWLVFDIINKAYPRVLQDIIQTIFTIYGIVFWGKNV